MGRIGIGVGDMKKSVYDPDLDGLIALAQLVAAVCSETEADTKVGAEATARGEAISDHAGLATVHQDAPTLISDHAGLPNAHHTSLTFTVAETEIFASANCPLAFTDLDCSSVVGANYALVLFKVTTTHIGGNARYVFRRNGDTEDVFYSGCSGNDPSVYEPKCVYVLCPTDSAGIVEWKGSFELTASVDIIAYFK